MTETNFNNGMRERHVAAKTKIVDIGAPPDWSGGLGQTRRNRTAVEKLGRDFLEISGDGYLRFQSKLDLAICEELCFMFFVSYSMRGVQYFICAKKVQ
ncbi:hypothetical protein [Methylocella sp.]|uniref:hypothetical protein n=1 Tax=Methylocella sp. TaxID=1978226 RepID=UPI003783F8A8